MQPLEAEDPARIGPYQLLARLGSGGMGKVYLAYSPGGRPVALKVVRPELADDAQFRTRFRREVAAVRMVSGALTAPVLDADGDGPVPWLATAYVAGPSLREAIEAYGPLTEVGVRRLGAGLAEALAAVHEAGLIHRDLKPSNVLLTGDGPCLIDFGVSRAVDGTAVTAVGSIIGTPGFMSPEQILADGPVSTASDVFSLGGVLVFAATGTAPFGSGSAEAMLYRVVRLTPDLEAVPAALRPTVAACLDKDPARRPGPGELLDLLVGDGSADPESWLSPGLRAELSRRERLLAEIEAWSPAERAEKAAATGTRVPAIRRTGMSRRRFVALAGGTTAGLGMAGGIAAWAFGGEHRTTPNTGDVGSLVGRTTGPKPVWTFRTSAPSLNRSLITAGTTVYLACDELDVIDGTNGRRKWSNTMDGPAILVSASRVYAWDVRTGLHILDAHNGGQQAIMHDDEIQTVMQIVGRTEGLLCVRGFFRGSLNTESVFAFDTARKRVIWKRSLAKPTDVVAVGRHWYLRSGNSLYALDPATGREIWQVPLAAYDYHSLVPFNGTLYTTTPDSVTARDLSGQPVWTAPVPGGKPGAIALAGHTLCCPVADTVFAFDAATGAPRWRSRTSAPLAVDSASLAVSSALVAVAFDRTRASSGFAVLDTMTGATRWAYRTSGDHGTQWDLTVTDSTVYAYDGTRLQAFRG